MTLEIWEQWLTHEDCGIGVHLALGQSSALLGVHYKVPDVGFIGTALNTTINPASRVVKMDDSLLLEVVSSPLLESGH